MLVLSMYYMIITYFGLIKFKDKKKFAPQKKFAMLVAAHNEEAVINGVVDSLHKIDYPKELYDIYVIADNCTDNTANVARNSGAIVYERTNKDKRGKGFALDWMFSNIFKMDKKYDAVVILDADNLVAKNFLSEMNNKLCEGYEVVQGYLDSKNPTDTWITGNYSISFWTNNRMYQNARKNLHLSSQLGGTGFAVSTEVLKELGWGATCLVEDLEFSCKLVLNGKRVGYAHEAVVYDEKPLTLAQSWYQRKRWMQGFADVASRYFFKLIKRAVTKLDFKALDCAIYSIQPHITALSGLVVIVSLFMNWRAYLEDMYHISGILQIISNIGNIASSQNAFNVAILSISAILILFQIVYVPLVLFLEKKLSFKVLLYCLTFPVYLLTWIPICILGILNKDKKEWNHTIHTRNVNINELEKVN
nr:glycosyltransferase family 2 protein [Clostridium oryzae]